LLQSQVIKAGGFVFLAGQVPTDNKARPVGATVAEKTHKMCQNAAAVLEAAGSSLDKVVKVTVRE
jgi:enamine deaminase RidA (YjgF/YER057c/UK114 family)